MPTVRLAILRPGSLWSLRILRLDGLKARHSAVTCLQSVSSVWRDRAVLQRSGVYHQGVRVSGSDIAGPLCQGWDGTTDQMSAVETCLLNWPRRVPARHSELNKPRSGAIVENFLPRWTSS